MTRQSERLKTALLSMVSATRAREYPGGTFGLPCVLVVKRLTEGERHDKSKLNDILRDHGAAT